MQKAITCLMKEQQSFLDNMVILMQPQIIRFSFLNVSTFGKRSLAMYNCFTESMTCSYPEIVHQDQTQVEGENQH